MDYAIKSTKYLLSKDDGLLAFSVHSLSAREKVISCNNSIINPHRLAIVLQHYKKLRKTQEDKRTQVEIRRPTAVEPRGRGRGQRKRSTTEIKRRKRTSSDSIGTLTTDGRTK